MFYARMEEYQLERPTTETDQYNHSHITWQRTSSLLAYIVQQEWTDYDTNDLKLSSASYVGYTWDNRVNKGWRIAGRYVVDSINVGRRGYRTLYLKEVDDG